jgi:hypothetical protein
VVLLFFFCRRSSSLSPAFSLVVASCGAGPRQRASRRATRARCARRACVTGGSRRRSRARMSRVWCSLLLSSSLVLSRRARRSLDPPARRRGGAHHERARGARDARRDAHGAWGIRAPSALGARGLCFARRLIARFCLCCSRCAVSRAPLPRSAARRGRAHHARARGARSARRDARGAWGVRAPRALGARGPGSRERPSWASLGLPPAPRALLLRSLRSPRPPAGEAHAERAGARRTRCAVWRTRRAGTPREVGFPLSRFAVRACSLSFAPLLTARRAAPSLPAEEARSRERAHGARAI